MTEPSERRILTLPAVHPCEAISPATLLHALIALCHEILAYRSEPFRTHRRSIRETTREVGILLAFLEGVRDCDDDSALPGSVVLSFSELHVTLQKIRQLLQDCARRGARLWILMMSDRVTSEFRVLIRSIYTALDALRLASIDTAAEVKELVQLLARQAWEVAIETDPADDRVVRAVRSILKQFEAGVAPAPADLKRILDDHLRLQSWSECSDEILFLEDEFFTHRNAAKSNGGESVLLGSLIGFMSYSRAALFDAVDDDKKSKRTECKLQETSCLTHLNSDDLRCPITLELMTDPVTIATGHTYDRTSIERWFKSGNLSCPVTGEKLTNRELVPNSSIRKIITQLCHSNNIPVSDHHQKRDLSKTHSPTSRAAAGAIRLAAALLVDRLATGTGEAKNNATYDIRLLCKSSMFNRACFVEAGSVPWLLHQLYSFDPSIQENAIAALLNLSKHPKGRASIHEAGGLALIIEVIREGLKVEAQQNAAAILFYLSSVKQYRQEIGEIPEAIPTLVELLRRGTYRGKKNAVVTLFGLLLFPGNHWKVLAAGAIPALTGLLSAERDDLVTDSIWVLTKLAEKPEGTHAILQSSAVPQLVEVLRSSTSRSGREHCVSVLLSLCNNGGEKVVSLLEKIPLLIPTLYSLVTDGSPQAGKKARTLLNHIHRLHEEDNPAILASPVHDRIIHAQ